MPGQPSILTGLRLGSGYALAELGADRPLRIAGEDFDGLPGTEGDDQDDGDCASRALVEALLGAAGLPGLSAVFPEEHPDRYYADSYELLRRCWGWLRGRYIAMLLQCNVQVFHAQPKLLQAGAARMRERLASALMIDESQIGITLHSLPGQTAQPLPDEIAASASVLCVLAAPAPQPAGRPESPRSMSELKSILRELEEAKDDPPVKWQQEAVPAEVWQRIKGQSEEDEDLPERARKFERGAATKLYPLPLAPPPSAGDLLIVYTDGASRGNPGPAATGWCVMNELGQLVHEAGTRLGSMTNNQAEYRAVLEAAQWVERELGTDLRLELRMDSQLIQRQLTGEYRIKDEGLKPLALQVMNILMGFSEMRIVHIPREENSRADALANLALDSA